MGVLVVAPSRPDLPNVAQEAAAVVNALGGRLLQGPVAEQDVRDAAAEGGFDGIWFATHAGLTPEGEVRVQLSSELLSEAAVVAYVAASGASWCLLNTCASNVLGLRILDETPADVICTISPNPDPAAMRTGVLFARQLALLGDPRTAYERSKPGGNRLYTYLDNYRRREMAAVNNNPAGGYVGYPAPERLQATMDEMRKDMAKVVTDVELLKSQTTRIDSRQQRMEDRLDEIERVLRPEPTWQTWAMLIFGLIACIGIVFLLVRAGG
jgi:hypothetical protein